MARRQALLVVMSMILAGCADTHGQATRRPGGRSTARAVAGRGVHRLEPAGPVSFEDAVVGYGAGASGTPANSRALLETVDGGRSWTQIARLPDPATYLRAVPAGVALTTTGHRAYFVTRRAGVTRIHRIGRLSGATTDRPWRPVAPARFPGAYPRIRWRIQVRRAGSSEWALLSGPSIMNQQAYVAYRSTDGGRSFRPVFAGGYADPLLHDLLSLPEIDSFSGPFEALPHGGAVFLGSCAVCDPPRWTALVTHNGRTWSRTTYQGAMPSTVPAWLTRP